MTPNITIVCQGIHLFKEMPADVLEGNISVLNTTISLDDLRSLLSNNPVLDVLTLLNLSKFI